jgi:putative FmdB family regulatory protein
MARYDFCCPNCKNVIEVTKSINDDTVPLCFQPGCDGKNEMEQLIRGTSFALKGLGWASEGYSKHGVE